ncbi:hypothetical protein KIPB_015240, partial [Kipferlia bialata]|eukprot:g15240.t1
MLLTLRHKELALPYLAYLLYRHFNLHTACSLPRYVAAMTQFQRMYRTDVPTYHTDVHAVDVLQMTSVMLASLRQSSRGRYLCPSSLTAVMLLAAAAHDVEHCGVGSDLISNLRHPLYHVFGPESTLERYHAMLGQFTLRYYGVFTEVFDEQEQQKAEAKHTLFSTLIMSTDPK